MLRSTLVLLALPLTTLAADKFEFKDGDRVVLIGSTLIEREQRYGYWEAALTARNPDKNITFRNLGWSGDTVWGEARAGFGTVADGYKQLVDHVIAEKPTVIIVGYGTNESFAGPEGLPKFQKQLKKLLDDLSATKARFVLLSPMKMFKMPPPLPDPAKANENLKLYGEAIATIAKDENLAFLDLAKAEAEFEEFSAPRAANWLITDDGFHLNETGYSIMAPTFREWLGDPMRIWRVTLNVETNTAKADLTKTEMISWNPVRFRSAAHHFRDYFDKRQTLPAGLLTVTGLSKGKFELKVDGKTTCQASSEAFAKEIEVFNQSDVEQYDQLRQTIIAKNKLYFYRWRPQNVTYLFGFRKHEQGNNAIEIPKFDPLIAEKEKEIAKLRVPREHVYELVPVKEKK